MFNIRPATILDIKTLAENLRPEDRREVEAEGGDVLETITKSFNASEISRAALLNGKLAVIFGAVKGNDGGACLWCLTTPEVESAKLSFMKETKKFIAECLNKYSFVWNGVDARYLKAVKWVERFGGIITKKIDVNGNDFYVWTIRRK